MEIRFFKLYEKDILLKAIHNLWSKNHILSRDEKLLEYMFYNTPGHHLITNQEHFSFLGAWVNEKLVGLLGVMPFVFNYKGKKGLCCCLTNWIVAEEARTTGAGLALIDKVHSFNPDMILSLGVSEAGSKIYKLMRWNIQPEVGRWVGLVNKERTIQTLLDGEKRPLRYFNEIKEVEYQGNYIANYVENLTEEEWNLFYTEHLSKESIGISRDTQFIKWRYENHPSFDYKILVCKSNGLLKGLIIYRIEQLQNGEKIGRIVECIVSNQDSAIVLANMLVKNKELLFYDFYCFTSNTTWGLESVGFKKIYNSQTDLYTIPSRFQPIDLHNTSMIAAIYFSEKIKNSWNIALENQLYITKADSDQDRPN